MVAQSVEIKDFETGEVVGELNMEGVFRTDDEVVEEMMQDLTRYDGAIPMRKKADMDDGQGTGIEPVEPGDDRYFLALSEALPSPYKIDAPPEDIDPELADAKWYDGDE